MSEQPLSLRPLGWTGPTGVTVSAHLHYTAATDNMRGRRQTVITDTAEVYDWSANPHYKEDGWEGNEICLPRGLDLFRDGCSARFLLINKVTGEVALYYVASYHPERRNIGLKRETGSTVFDGNVHGPKKMYTLFVTQTERLGS
jgi:hypothetical protein